MQSDVVVIDERLTLLKNLPDVVVAGVDFKVEMRCAEKRRLWTAVVAHSIRQIWPKKAFSF